MNNRLKSNTVTEGEFKGFQVKFDIEFRAGGDHFETIEAGNREKYNGESIGNSIVKKNKNTDKYFADRSSINEEGQTVDVGGVTDRQTNSKITMNSEKDSFKNRLHEVFHTLGFSHPNGVGGEQGIMKYPPEKPTQTDINQIANDDFLKKDFGISTKLNLRM